MYTYIHRLVYKRVRLSPRGRRPPQALLRGPEPVIPLETPFKSDLWDSSWPVCTVSWPLCTVS